jgi:hypothetical protein
MFVINNANICKFGKAMQICNWSIDWPIDIFIIVRLSDLNMLYLEEIGGKYLKLYASAKYRSITVNTIIEALI